MIEVAAAEFTKDFTRYGQTAQHEPVAVTDADGTIGYFVSAQQFEEFCRVKAASRRSRAVGELSEAEIAEIAASRMSAEHDHLDALLGRT